MQQGLSGILFSEKNIRGWTEMVFVCDHCHFELEAAAKPCQCPDCGKVGHIRTATAEEGQAFQARKLVDVWHDPAPALTG